MTEDNASSATGTTGSRTQMERIWTLVDTPGHADFGGEVERIMKMVDGVLLVVDAYEGPMPQTKFVLGKALKIGLKPIVVINKADKADARPNEVLDEIFDLFVSLDANDEQLDFPVIYASAKNGIAKMDLSEETDNVNCIFETIIKYIPSPSMDKDSSLQFQPALLDYTSTSYIIKLFYIKTKKKEYRFVLFLPQFQRKYQLRAELLCKSFQKRVEYCNQVQSNNLKRNRKYGAYLQRFLRVQG